MTILYFTAMSWIVCKIIARVAKIVVPDLPIEMDEVRDYTDECLSELGFDGRITSGDRNLMRTIMWFITPYTITIGVIVVAVQEFMDE